MCLPCVDTAETERGDDDGTKQEPSIQQDDARPPVHHDELPQAFRCASHGGQNCGHVELHSQAAGWAKTKRTKGTYELLL